MSHQYKVLPDDQLQDLFSTFLIDSWSYSKVSQFARNEKAFEMQHIYGLYSKLSTSSIAGNAYHTALEYYFNNLKDGLVLPLVELEASAFQYLDGIPGNKWKLSKSTPTVEEAMIKATKTVTALLKNFYQEKALYEDVSQKSYMSR
jgi:S-DNA-T family DNA segregation ATPase FtsK/SpoIIIE